MVVWSWEKFLSCKEKFEFILHKKLKNFNFFKFFPHSVV